MLDVRLIRENAAFVRERLATRHAGDEAKILEVVALDEERRKLIVEVEQLKATRNRVSKEIGALMGQKKLAEAEAKKAETKEIGERITDLDAKVKMADEACEAILLRLPNLPHASVAVGKTAEENPEIRTWGQKAEFPFKPKSHVELCEQLKLIDFVRGAKLSGFTILINSTLSN